MKDAVGLREQAILRCVPGATLTLVRMLHGLGAWSPIWHRRRERDFRGKRRGRMVEEAALGGYVFLPLAEVAAARRAMTRPGCPIARFMRRDGRYDVVRDEELEPLREQVAELERLAQMSDAERKRVDPLPVGVRARVVAGALEGYMVEVIAAHRAGNTVTDLHRRLRVTMSAGMLQRAG